MRSTESSSDNQALIQAYLQHLQLEQRFSENSVKAVRRDLLLITQPVATVTSTDLKAILAKRHATSAAPSSLARLASSWRGFFKYLAAQGIISSSPAEGLKTPRKPKLLPKAVGVDPLVALLEAPYPSDFRFAQAHLLIELLYCTGLRISEAMSLSTEVFGGGATIQVVGKGNKTRVVPLIGSLLNRLAQFKEQRDQHLQKTGNCDPSCVFLSSTGQPLSVRQAQRDVAAYASLCGLGQHLHPHMLRHSFGSHVLQASQNLRAVQELLGHASIASTQIYTALDFDHLSKVYDASFPRAK